MAASDTRSHTMVAKFTAQIISQKLDFLLSHPVCMDCLLMQSRVKDAKAKLARIQEFLSTEYKPPKTTEWSGRLLRAMYYAEEFIDKFHLREAHQKHEALNKAAWPIATLVSKYKLGRDLSTLVNKMDELCNDQFLKEEAEGKSKKKPASSSSHASVPRQGKKLARLTSFWDRQAPTNFLCHKAKMEEIMEKMDRHSYREISILGEQGAGKTFLARWVYSQAKYMGYEWRAWVHFSGSKDEREFLFEILKQVDKLASDLIMDMDIKEIQSKLYQKLAEKKKVIIVLDDVLPSDRPILDWFYVNVYRISKGCTITTTQDKEIAYYMSWPRGETRLEKLDEDKSKWMLAGKLHRGSDSILKEEMDILKICPGWPLHISLLGGILSNAGEHERMVLAKEGSTMTLSDILQLSCHNLSVHLIPCFIYMTLFPITFPIPTRRLVRLWLAEGLLDSHCYDIERERTRQPEDVGERFIMELADRNVIDVVSWRADGSPKACQMLTSLYDMIHPIAMSAGFLHTHAKSKSKDGQDRDPTSEQRQVLAQSRERTRIRWLAEHTNIVIDDHSNGYLNLDLGQVRSFLSFYLRRGILTNDINSFLKEITSKTGYSLLRVLDLEGVYKPSLDDVLHKLALLRYLGLRSTALDWLPSAVANLHHLETLDIKHTDVTLLPSSLWKVRSLRHLHLNWFYINLKNILKACSNNVNALTQLQTLSGLVVGEVNEKLMRDHMDSLTTLTTLKLYLQRSGGDASGVAEKAVANWISFRLTNLQSLTFGVIPEDKPIKEDKTKKEAKPTEEAEPAKKEDKTIGLLPGLSLAEHHHDLLELYLLGQLSKPIWTRLLPVSLRVLTLSGSNLEKDAMPQLGGILRHLRTFRLLANSFVGTSMTFAKDGFPSLKILKIWKLPHLQELIIQPGALLHLQELEFRRLDKMKNVEGIRERKELENICVVVKKGARDFVDHLWGRIGWECGYLYEREDTETPRPSDDDEGDRDDKGEMLYLHVEKEGRLPTDDAFMDDDFKNLLDLRQKLAENKGSQSMVDNFINLLKKNLLNLRVKISWTNDYDKWLKLQEWIDRHIKNQGRQVVDADFMDMLNLFRQFLNFRKSLYRL